MRYSKQRTKSTCGPVAIFNALKWAGVSGSYRKIVPRLKRACRTEHYPKGTYSWVLHEVLKKEMKRVGVSVELRWSISQKSLLKNLTKNKSVIISYSHKKGGGHYGLVIKGTKNYPFKTINFYSDTPATYKRTRRKFYRHHGQRIRMAWILTKK